MNVNANSTSTLQNLPAIGPITGIIQRFISAAFIHNYLCDRRCHRRGAARRIAARTRPPEQLLFERV
eukprot:6192213-Pleurochrysis_carterae.AAC.4